MSPSQESIDEVVGEFDFFVNSTAAFYGLARVGLIRRRDEIESHKVDHGDVPMMLGSGHPDDETHVVGSFLHLSEVLAFLELRGPGTAQNILANQWVVFLFASWEENYRKRIAQARGLAVNDIGAPVFGDVRHLRNDILHHRGIATEKNSGKCSLLAHMIQIGRPIELTSRNIYEIVDLIPWSDLQGASRVYSARQRWAEFEAQKDSND